MRNMKQSGFTLLEVLIAVVVFSIGLLGLASLQAMMLKLTSDSLDRSIAVMLANDMVDRMRANVASATLGLTSPYNNPSKAYTANPSCYGMNSSGGTASGVQCTSAQMAANDFADWYASLSGSAATGWRPAIPAALPEGDGVVCIDSTPKDGTPGSPACDGIISVPGKPVYSIKIWWIERKDVNNPGTLHQYVTSFSL
jgi:type IV pilus assembly protein PilV